MSIQDKSKLWQELKAAGVTFNKHYRDYSVSELQGMIDRLHTQEEYQHESGEPESSPAHGMSAEALLNDEPYDGDWMSSPMPSTAAPAAPVLHALAPAEPIASAEAYQASNEDSAIRVDPDTGFVWFREEVRKPAYAKPRARRVLRYIDSGTQQRTVSSGNYIETFEEAGNEQRQGEVKITVPSFQVGVYKDPKLPFKIHVYNDVRGFDLFDVQRFYGSADMVPSSIKRMYVLNDLCYDIRTTIREIETEYRNNQLKGYHA